MPAGVVEEDTRGEVVILLGGEIHINGDAVFKGQHGAVAVQGIGARVEPIGTDTKSDAQGHPLAEIPVVGLGLARFSLFRIGEL